MEAERHARCHRLSELDHRLHNRGKVGLVSVRLGRGEGGKVLSGVIRCKLRWETSGRSALVHEEGAPIAWEGKRKTDTEAWASRPEGFAHLQRDMPVEEVTICSIEGARSASALKA
jgi:hypothetical protein